MISTPVWAGDAELAALSDELLKESQNLWRQTYKTMYTHEKNEAEMAETIDALKALIEAYQRQAGFITAPPLCGVIQGGVEKPIGLDQRYLGMSSGVKDGMSVFYTDERTRKIPYRKIKVEHITGDVYVRFKHIKVITARGREYEFDAGRGKFYLGNGFEVELPHPAFISEIRVHVQHRTGGLRITGQPAPKPIELPTVVKMGVTNGVKDGYAVLHTTELHRKVRFRKLRIKNIGGDEYVRLREVQVTTISGREIVLEVRRVKFQPNDVMELDLPKAVHIKSVKIKVQHRVAGLAIEGVR